MQLDKIKTFHTPQCVSTEVFEGKSHASLTTQDLHALPGCRRYHKKHPIANIAKTARITPIMMPIKAPVLMPLSEKSCKATIVNSLLIV